MSTFGKLLKKYRQRCIDPLSESPLSQERLGELIGYETGGGGYSGVSISNWERDKSKISADQRRVLLAIIAVLHKCRGLNSAEEADRLLHAGNYRALDDEELNEIFGKSGAGETTRRTKELKEPPGTDEPEGPNETDAENEPAAAPGSDASSVPLPRNRELILFDKVRRFWIEGVLENSLENFTTIELEASRVPGAVQNVWGSVTTPLPGDYRLTLDDRMLLDLFSSSGSALLILGAPGAGKSFTLLRLARQLLNRARENPARAIPVVLNLSSWAENEANLHNWVLDELAAKYQIPKKFGRTWLENDRLILLLDGLDEVSASARDACIIAINNFRKEYGFTGIVVCSRISSYRQSAEQLLLDTAIQLHPLDPEQIIRILDEAGILSEQIRRTMEDERMLGLIQSPLVLRVLASMAREEGFTPPAPESDTQQERDDYHSALIHGYVEQSLAEPRAEAPFEPQRVKKWLGWLAARMSEHNQSELHVERIQPSWLPTAGWRWFYTFFTRLVDGAMAGIILWLLLLQLRFVHPELPIGVTQPLAFGAELAQATREFIWLVGSNTLLGFLLVAAVEIFFYERRPLARISGLTQHRQHIGQIVVVGILVFLFSYAIGAPLGDPLLIVFWSLVQAIVHMLIARFIHGATYRTEFRNMNAIAWSWRRTGLGLAIGLLMAIFAEVLEYGYGVDNGIWPTLLAYGTTGVLLGGLSGQRIEKGARPNQGMRQAAANAVLATAIAAPTLGIVAFSLWDTSSLRITTALILFSAFTFFGGSAIIDHLLLRLIFWYKDLLPRDLIGLLEYATDRSLMRKVGGGFIFVHPLIQDHFRRLDQERNA